MPVIESVLALARWAPSGDNTQPWRFVVKSDTEVEVHGYDTHTHCVYDLDGAASQFAHGALIETLSIAASRFRCGIAVEMEAPRPSGRIVYRVRLTPDASVEEDSLASAIEKRVVQRRPMSPRPLTPAEKADLEAAAHPYRIAWMDTSAKRRTMASLNAFSAHIRLTTPEAFAVHKATIDWGVTTSVDKMPSPSLGAPWFFEPVMRNAMASWERVDRLNRYFGGTVMPRVFLDWMPGLLCSAHFALIAPERPSGPADYVAAGRATQRFWLTATSLELQVQPLYTPLVFANYAREGRNFTRVEAAKARARQVLARLNAIFGEENARRAVFLGRVGPARPVKGRSMRLPLERLIVEHPPEELEATH